ncbi:hypothetical protein BC628DRAFT_357054 [Trametes gibbosa]|nr:hypothetical protein BC628DRAFT_357054 [Trametes gibbosa]
MMRHPNLPKCTLILLCVTFPGISMRRPPRERRINPIAFGIATARSRRVEGFPPALRMLCTGKCFRCLRPIPKVDSGNSQFRLESTFPGSVPSAVRLRSATRSPTISRSAGGLFPHRRAAEAWTGYIYIRDVYTKWFYSSGYIFSIAAGRDRSTSTAHDSRIPFPARPSSVPLSAQGFVACRGLSCKSLQIGHTRVMA